MSDTNPLQDCFSQSNHDVNGRRDEYRPFEQQVAFNHYLSVDNNSGDHSDNEALLKARLARADQRIQESLNREQVTGFEKAFYRANELLMIEKRKDFASMDKDAAALAQWQTDLGIFQQWAKGFSDDLQALLYRYYCYYYKVQGRDAAQAFLQLLQQDQAIDLEDQLFLNAFLAAFSPVYQQIITLAYRLLVWFEGRERAEQFFKQAPRTQQTKSFESVAERYVFEVGDLMDVLYSHPYLLRNRSKKRDLMKGKCTTQVLLKNSVVESQFVQFDLLDIARVYCELQGISLPQGGNDLVIIRKLMDVKVWGRKLEVKNRRLREKNHQARVGRGGELYLSNNSYEEYQERKKGEQAFIENQVLVSDQGDELLLADAVKSSINNPDHRFTEFMIKANGLEQLKKEEEAIKATGDYMAVFVTLTVPSKYKPKRILSAKAYREQFAKYHYTVNVSESDFLANSVYQKNPYKAFKLEDKTLYSVTCNRHGDVHSFIETKGEDKGQRKYVVPNLNYQSTFIKSKQILSAKAYREQFAKYHYTVTVSESDFSANSVYQKNPYKVFKFEGKTLYSVAGNRHGDVHSFIETKGKDKGQRKYVVPNLNYQSTVIKPNKKVVRRTETADHKKLYQVVDNSPRVAQDYLVGVFADIRTDLKNLGFEWRGYRVVEPTHDGVPHWHLALYVRRDQLAMFEKVLRDRALEVDGYEKGAEKYRVDIKHLDMNEYILDENGKPTDKKHSIAAYIAKYVGKGVSDERVLAWKSLYGIRQFDFYGIESVSVYRELRRVDKPLDNPRIEAVRLAADQGDWAAFTKAKMNCSITCRHELVRDSSGEVIYNKYGEERKRLTGLEYGDDESGALGFIPTRDRVWFAINLNALEQRMVDGLPRDRQANKLHFDRITDLEARKAEEKRISKRFSNVSRVAPDSCKVTIKDPYLACLDRIADLKARALEEKKVSKLFFGLGGVAPDSFLAAVGASSPLGLMCFNCVNKKQAKGCHPSSNCQAKPPD